MYRWIPRVAKTYQIPSGYVPPHIINYAITPTIQADILMQTYTDTMFAFSYYAGDLSPA